MLSVYISGLYVFVRIVRLPIFDINYNISYYELNINNGINYVRFLS